MLAQMFGETAFVKVLDFLLEEWETDFSIGEVARETGLTWKSVAPLMPLLAKHGLVSESRRIGRATLFKLNADSKLFRGLRRLDLVISSEANAKRIKAEPQKIIARTVRKK